MKIEDFIKEEINNLEERRQTLEEKILHWRVMLKERIIELKDSPDYDDGYELAALEERLKDYDSFFHIKVDRGNAT